MRTSTKIWLILAALLVAAGLILFGAAMTVHGWDFHQLSTVTYETNTYEIREDFTNISIVTDTAGIVFLPSPDGQCRVECYEQEKKNHTVTVQEGTLALRLTDSSDPRDYFQYIGINVSMPQITVYLPETQYASLSVDGSTGAVTVPKDFAFQSVELSLTTGAIDFSASVDGLIKLSTSTGLIRLEHTSVGALELSVTTGQIALSDVTCTGTVNTKCTTGQTQLTDIRCENLFSRGSTGDLTMENVIAADSFSLERSTGNITFDRCDASEIVIRTDTGDVRGSLLSEKVFIAQTDTGLVTVPRVGSGGMCQIDTDTGDIYITLVR